MQNNTQGSLDNPDKLTDWVNEPKLSELKSDFIEAESDLNSHISDVTRWLDNLYVRGTAKVKVPKGRSSITPKLIRKQAEWRYAALSEPFLSTADLFNVNPVTFEDKGAAEQNELVINNQFNTKLNKVGFIGSYVRTGVNEGTIICKVGWINERRKMLVDVPEYEYRIEATEEALARIQELVQLQQADPALFEVQVPLQEQEALRLSLEQGTPVIPYKIGMVKEEKEVVLRNHPSVQICDFDAVIIDPTCEGDLDKAKFIIHRFETTLSDLKSAGIYKNLDDIQISNASILSAHDSSTGIDNSSFNFKDKPRTKIMAYEYWGYWDTQDTGIVTPFVATWVGDVLIRMEENPYPDQSLPFVVVPYLPINKSIYGEPDGELLEDNQKIVGAVTRGMIDIMGRSANGQIGARKDALDITNRRKFLSGEDYEFNPIGNPEQAFHMHKFPEIPQSAPMMLEMQNNEAESLTGVKAFSSGISGSALGSTATGIRSALDATSKRDLDILRRLADGIVQIGRKFIAMNAMFLSDKEVIRITNEKFVEVRRDDLPGNFDLKLTISTAEEDNQKAEELAFMLQTLGNNFDFGLVKMILADIAKLRKMPTLAQDIKNYEVQPDPIAVRKAELEVALLEAQVQEVMAKAQKLLAESQLNEVKSGTEIAKADNLNSQTGKNDLDFVEQESGVNHARNMEQDGAQARAQLQTKVVEHFLKREAEDKKPK